MTSASATCNRPRRRALRGLALAGICALAAACGQTAGGDRARAPQAAQPAAPATPQADLSAPLPVALLLPLGADGEAGERARGVAEAARMAASEFGAEAIALRILDTGGTPAGAAGAARQAVEGGAQLILGPATSANTGPAAAAAAPRGINVISFSTDATVAGGNVWLAGLLPSDEAQRVLGFAARNGRSGLGIFRPDTPYGAAARRAAGRAAAEAGMTILADTAYNRSFEGIEAASQPYAQEHRAAGADAVLLPEDGLALRTAAAFLEFHGVSARANKFLGLGTWIKDPGTLKERSLHGGWFAAPDPFRLAQFEDAFEARTGRPATPLAHLGYDVVAAAAEMARRGRDAGDATPFDAAAITDPGGFAGATGAFRFTPDGLNRRALAVLEVSPEGFIVADPAPAAAPGLRPGS
ncbi:penicillin-binding protein activator [Rhodovulum sp. DZ06]|uniref:penicillin-binding protein activator n=1 Tax=Rhodovulum sp. DZ06 TaxID=3425126 RepID=UPI003D358284